jgi:multidrug transporter EmrE-like cation transporter
LSSVGAATVPEKKFDPRQRSIALVMLCTFIGAAAQVFIKLGVSTLPHVQGVVPNMLAMATNPRLVSGYSLYGISAVLLVLAFRHGELSLLYPVIALTYVWVAILSVLVFHEQLSAVRIAGIATIVVGVGVLGRGSKS